MVWSLGSFGSFMSPFLIDIADTYSFDANLLIGMVFMIGAIPLFYMPETFGKPLEDDVEEDKECH